MNKDEALALVKAKGWYHDFEVFPGIQTGGKVQVNAKVALDTCGVPADLRGKVALDIGAWDGPYTFELERRGATVFALDIQDPDRTGFNTAKRIKGSSASYRRSSVYEIPEEWNGTFDVVLYLGVFYHLLHPLLAFQRIYRALKPNGHMFYEGATLDHADQVDGAWAGKGKGKLLKELRDKPVCLFVREKYCNDDSNWFIPTDRCLQDWARATGFDIVKSGTYAPHARSWGAARKIPDFQEIQHAII